MYLKSYIQSLPDSLSRSLFLVYRDKSGAEISHIHSSAAHQLPSGDTQIEPDTDTSSVFLLRLIFAYSSLPRRRYIYVHTLLYRQGVTKRCRLFWLTNSDLVYEPKSGVWGGGGGLRSLSQMSTQCT